MTQLPRPICTVVIPLYNYADKVARAIKSVMAQTANNIECIIVDDGSADNPADTVLPLIKNDARFRFLSKPNGGVATARNYGVDHGTGKYVCCLDADDAIDPLFIEVCVTYLEEHLDVDIAYTGLHYVRDDGSEGDSPWPPDFDYSYSMIGRNQIPTCNVMKRTLWEKLGGQRQRYAPLGAGEEDAEMWLRCIAYGARAKKVSDNGLFIYSWQSGRVSGNREHRMTDYHAWHPWTRDRGYPFAASFTPDLISHRVRQYDEPVVSVVIPVGPGHSADVINALDSLDAQEFRKWEAIVVWDTDESPDFVLRVFPHIVFVDLRGDGCPHGAGYARNRGVDVARAPLLLYLDADDWFVPDAISTMFMAWEKTGNAIYSDYIGKAYVNDEFAARMELEGRLMDYDRDTGIATIAHRAADYDCERAISDDALRGYIWNTISTLSPRSWHYEIGGFDESMKSWEDWDYYMRLARAGKCFTRVESQLLVYRFYSGKRRDSGIRMANSLIKYLLDKYKRIKTMSCGCSQGKTTVLHNNVRDIGPRAENTNSGVIDMSDDSFKLIRYMHPNSGQHRVIGSATGVDYGQRGGGEEFLVHEDDVAANPSLFAVVRSPTLATAAEVSEAFQDNEVVPPPELIEDDSGGSSRPRAGSRRRRA